MLCHIPFITGTFSVKMPTKRNKSQSASASHASGGDSKFSGMFSALKTKLRRSRTGSVDGDPSDKLSEYPSAKCATLPARVSGVESTKKPKTLHWMAGLVDELDFIPSPVSREDSEESVDSGFHGFHRSPRIEERGNKVMVIPASTSGGGKIYDVATVEKAFGPLKDVGRWYSTYSNSRQQPVDEGRYVHRPLRLQHSLDEEERLTSRPLPPIPPPVSNQAPPVSNQAPSVLNQAPRIPPPVRDDTVYEHVEQRMLGTNGLCLGLRDLSHHGWYWGPITRVEAEERLGSYTDGTFLVRDSSDDRYLLSLSFRSQGKTLHTRIEYSNGCFSFYSYPDSDSEGFHSVVELIKKSMEHSQEGVFCFSRARALGSPAVPVRLLKPFSRYNHVRSLQHYCRFAIRQSIRFDLIRKLPLPRHVHGFLEQSQF